MNDFVDYAFHIIIEDGRVSRTVSITVQIPCAVPGRDVMRSSGARARREASSERLSGSRFAVLVLGGGSNGAVSAAALAARGARVALVDRLDFAAVTSQASSNLAWGG